MMRSLRSVVNRASSGDKAPITANASRNARSAWTSKIEAPSGDCTPGTASAALVVLHVAFGGDP